MHILVSKKINYCHEDVKIVDIATLALRDFNSPIATLKHGFGH
jgi:hypothetical protein